MRFEKEVHRADEPARCEVKLGTKLEGRGATHTVKGLSTVSGDLYLESAYGYTTVTAKTRAQYHEVAR